MSLFEELKRRNVFRVGVAYIVASWVLLQVAELVLDAINAPDWVIQAMLMFVVLGFIAAMIIAWAYEMTPDGIKRESDVVRDESITAKTAARLDRITIGLLVVVVAIVVVERFVLDSGPGAAPQQAQVQAEPVAETTEALTSASATRQNSIAVLPFVAMSSGEDDEYFADGLTEEILNSLAQLPELLITARTSSFHFKGQDIPVTEIAEKLGVQNIVEGSVRRSGDRLRVTAQLVRAIDGFHLWSENYDSTSEDTIQVQEDIAEKIAVAMNVVMDDEKRDAMRLAGLRNVDAFIAWQKAGRLFASAHDAFDMVADLEVANEYYQRVLEYVPGYAPAHTAQADLYIHQLLSDAGGIGDSNLSTEEIEIALESANMYVSRGLDSARSFSEENNLGIDLAFLSGNWRGVGSRLDRYMDDDDCNHPSWLPHLSLPYDYADRAKLRYRKIRTCDPMVSVSWFDESRAYLWDGEADEALRIATRGMEVAPGTWLSYYMIYSLLALQKFEEADHAIERYVDVELNVASLMGAKYAAMGNAELALEHLEQGNFLSEKNWWFKLSSYARLGDRENANEAAAIMDKHPFGTQSLATMTSWCMCGAPFDLEVAPNFAANLKEAGFDWPPPSPIHWPLKTW